MLNGSDVALARLSEIAYLNTPSGLPLGFVPITQATLGLGLSAQESLNNGVYLNRNGAALVTVGTLNGVTTAALAFRGSDDREDSINDLQNINREYQLFPTLIASFDAFVARNNISQVAVTGHSLGGAMTQLYMASHANNATTSYIADTFGSPGALLSAATDTRITNVRISDDPAVYLGENRAAVGSQLRSTPALAAAAVFAGPEVFPGLTQSDVVASIGDLDTNYVNRGTASALADASGGFKTVNSINDAANSGKTEHLVQNYVARIETATNSTGDDQRLPDISPTTVGTQVFRFFDVKNGTHFYTSSATERDSTISTRSDLTYEGFGLNATTKTLDPQSAPVFRFFDTSNGSHFYTVSDSERASLASGSTGLTYEGIAFYEDTSKASSTSAVYRFFNTQDGSHFLTASGNERAGVLATRPDLVNEGVAFYTLSA